IEAIARSCRALTCRVSTSEQERLLFWAGRKAAFPAVGRISPDYYCMDGTIPRARLPQVLKRMRELSETYGLAVANVFQAADLKQQQRLKCAFDDKGLLNPGKVFPTLHRCAELGRMHVHAGRVPFPDIPRF